MMIDSCYNLTTYIENPHDIPILFNDPTTHLLTKFYDVNKTKWVGTVYARTQEHIHQMMKLISQEEELWFNTLKKNIEGEVDV